LRGSKRGNPVIVGHPATGEQSSGRMLALL
jgi:hypothetical protein